MRVGARAHPRADVAAACVLACTYEAGVSCLQLFGFGEGGIGFGGPSAGLKGKAFGIQGLCIVIV